MGADSIIELPPSQQGSATGTGAQQGSGAGSQQGSGAGSQHTGAGSQHTGAGSQHTGAGSQHTGAGSQQQLFALVARSFANNPPPPLQAGSQHTGSQQLLFLPNSLLNNPPASTGLLNMNEAPKSNAKAAVPFTKFRVI